MALYNSGYYTEGETVYVSEEYLAGIGALGRIRILEKSVSSLDVLVLKDEFEYFMIRYQEGTIGYTTDYATALQHLKYNKFPEVGIGLPGVDPITTTGCSPNVRGEPKSKKASKKTRHTFLRKRLLERNKQTNVKN